MFAKECPCCGRSAIEDCYYNTDETYTFCIRCGYRHTKKIKNWKKGQPVFKEETIDGKGIFYLEKTDGTRKRILLNGVTEEELEKLKASFMDDDVNQDKSYMVTFNEGEFTILLGNPPDNFHLSFEEYKEKMTEKYGPPEFEIMVAIEE
jgi:hypothetical protein